MARIFVALTFLVLVLEVNGWIGQNWNARPWTWNARPWNWNARPWNWYRPWANAKPGTWTGYHHSDHDGVKETHLSFSFNGDTIEETIVANPATFVATYRVQRGINEATVVDDYNKYLRVVRPPSYDRCVIAPIAELMVSFESGEDFAKWITNKTRQMTDASIHYYMRNETSPLRDTGCLNEEAKVVCQGLPVYWVIMTTKAYGSKGNTRAKKFGVSASASYGFAGGRGRVGGTVGWSRDGGFSGGLGLSFRF